MNIIRTVWGSACFSLPIVAAGCAATPDHVGTFVASPPPTPAPRLGAVVRKVGFAWSDKNNRLVADVTGESGAATGGNGLNTLGEIRNGKATLYQRGKPSATLTADTLLADSDRQRVTANGNVLVRSQSDAGGGVGTLQADHVVWEYEQGQIVGTGHVVLTREDSIRVHAVRLVADTALQTVDLIGEEEPTLGNH